MKKRKKLLFLGYNMEMGGAEKALINVMELLRKYYEIELILLEKKGILLNQIPSDIKVKAIKTNILKYILFRYIPFFRKKIINHTANGNYSFIVAFMEGRAATLAVDIKQDCPKYAWIHNDVSSFNIGISEKEIKRTYNNITKIIVVSKQSKENFAKKYNFNLDKIEVIYNLINEKEIISNSKLLTPDKKIFTFVTVAKMRPQKRYDRIIEAVRILKNQGYKFQFLFIGNGPLEEHLIKMINSYDLNSHIKLLGLLTNPYPYVKTADYFVLASDHEGYPLCLLEALLLKTKIISTDVSGAREMLEDGKYGFIIDISLDALVNKMREVMDKPSIAKEIETNLKDYKGANKQIEKQLLELFNIKKKEDI